MIKSGNLRILMDSHLEGNYPTEEATTLVDLVSHCLAYEPRDRPNIKKLLSVLKPLQKKSEVSVKVFILKNASCAMQPLCSSIEFLVYCEFVI